MVSQSIKTRPGTPVIVRTWRFAARAPASAEAGTACDFNGLAVAVMRGAGEVV